MSALLGNRGGARHGARRLAGAGSRFVGEAHAISRQHAIAVHSAGTYFTLHLVVDNLVLDADSAYGALSAHRHGIGQSALLGHDAQFCSAGSLGLQVTQVPAAPRGAR